MSLKAKEKRKENKHKLVPYDLSVRKPRSLGYKRLVYYIYYGKDADSLPEGNKEKQTNKYFLSRFALVRSAFLFSSPNSLHKCFYTLVKRRGFLHTKSSQIIYGNNAKSKENQQVLTKHSLK